MIKGSAVLKTKRNRRYVDIYDAWNNSDHDVMIVHCPNETFLKRAWMAAQKYREKNDLYGRISISRHSGDLYLMKLCNQTYAMEAYPQSDGWIFYYNTDNEKEIYAHD